MKLIINFLKFIGVLALIPLCAYLIIRFEPAEWSKNEFLSVAMPTALGFFCVVLICIRHFKKEQFTKVNFFRTILFSLALAVILHPFKNLIDCYGIDISDLSTEGITYYTKVLPLYTLLGPLLEELGTRIMVINTFKGKLPNWFLIISTSLFFGFLHYSVISNFMMGVILSFLFIRSGNGLLLILTHFFYNLFSFIPREYYVHFYMFLLEHIYIPIIAFIAILTVIILKKDMFKALLLSTIDKNR